MSTIDFTVLMEERIRKPRPCDNCYVGGGSISQFIDPITGHLMQESHDCSETCELIKRYTSKEYAII